MFLQLQHQKLLLLHDWFLTQVVSIHTLQKDSENLKLPAITQETLTIKVFGDEEGTLQRCDVIQFCIQSPYDERSAYVTAYVVPVLCAPLSGQAISSAVDNYPHLKGLWLADFPAKRNEQLDYDVLIGSNYYGHFFVG